MKMKILLLLICLGCIAYAANAQITVKPTNKINVFNQNNPIGVKGADLALQITSIDYTAGNYTINYTLKNIGNTNIDLKDVTMQGNIYRSDGNFVMPGAGLGLIYEGILNAGQEYKGKLGFSNKLYNNESYVYRLKADEHNKVAEINENNNVSEMPIIGYAEQPVVVHQMHREKNLKKGVAPLNDVTISIRNVEKRNGGYFIDFTIKNVGTSTIDFNNLSTQCYIRLASDATESLAPAGGSMLGINGMLAPNQEILGSRPVSYNLQVGQSYKFFIDVKLRIAESNLADNRAMRTIYNIQ